MSSRASTAEVDTGPAPAVPVAGSPAATADATPAVAERPATATPVSPASAPREIGGRAGPEPTRYGDWEKGGRCIDF